MTVSTEVDHNEYTGNGVTTTFPYTFRIFHKSDLVVQVVDLDENITVLILDADYTVTGAGGYTGGNVIMTSALTSGYRISISRELPVTQETDLRNQGTFFAEVHEDAFDKLTMLIQQARGLFSLALRKPSFIANYYDALNNRIRNMKDPQLPQDAVTLSYLEGYIEGGDSTLRPDITRTGAVGSNIQQAINISDAWQSVLTMKDDEVVSSLQNDYGVEIIQRRGRVFDTSGVQLTTYAEPKSRFVIGREYLWAIHKRMINSSINPGGTASIVWSGDSTTNGVNAGAWAPHAIANNLRFVYGIPSVQNYNEGHNAKTMVDWGYWYVNQDIAAYPNMDCYVLRWGINDGGVTSYEAFVKALRDGLTTLRTWKSVESLSVILMMPNTTSDTTTGKDEKWYEQISGALRQAARDFKCVFFDTYAIWRDARGYAPGAWLDDPYGDNRGIHPDYVFNAQIIGDVCELLYGPCASVNGKSNNFFNSPSTIQRISSAYPPNSFPFGIGIYRTDDSTWPVDGEVTVKTSIDGVVTQTLTGYVNNNQKITFTRYGTRNNAFWTDFRGQAFDITSAMLSNGWTVGASRSATYQKSSEGVVTINAMLIPGTVTSGATIMTLPADYLPKNVISYIACGANNGYASINILTNGQVQINSIPAGAGVLTINVTFPALVV